MLDYLALSTTPLERDPFDFVIVNRFIHAELLPSILICIPQDLGSGSHPIASAGSGRLQDLVKELNGSSFREAIESKFEINLKGRPTTCTIRTQTDLSDGNIHTDSKSKIITVLLYLNDVWTSEGGCLRLLRSPTNLDDYAAEIPPTGGTLLAFRRSDRSWHGHKPFRWTEERCSIQLDYGPFLYGTRSSQARSQSRDKDRGLKFPTQATLTLAFDWLNIRPGARRGAKAAIPPERLLVYEVSQGSQSLCGFLDVAVPGQPFPNTNTTDDFRQHIARCSGAISKTAAFEAGAVQGLSASDGHGSGPPNRLCWKGELLTQERCHAITWQVNAVLGFSGRWFGAAHVPVRIDVLYRLPGFDERPDVPVGHEVGCPMIVVDRAPFTSFEC